MATYIAPNSDIKIIFNCPLKPDYLHTIRFNNSTEQENYFYNTLSGITFPNNSYQRVGNNILKVGWNTDFSDMTNVNLRQPTIDKLYTANYMAFVNENYENKIFYAFITKVEYVNNNCCEITYIIDPIQTWLFKNLVTMPACFVERLTIDHDGIGANTVDEPLDIGNQYIENQLYTFHSDSYVVFTTTLAEESDLSFWVTFIANVVVSLTTAGYDATIVKWSKILKQGSNIGGLFYIGIEEPIERFTDDGFAAFEYICDAINTTGKGGSVLSVNIVPEFCFNAMVYNISSQSYTKRTLYYVFGENTQTNDNPLFNYPANEEVNINNPCVADNRVYNPKNKKLYQYPYNMLTISNRSGEQCNYKFEYFITPDRPQIGFNCVGTFIDKVTTICVPIEYSTQQSTANYEHSLNGGEYSTIPFINDTYKNWWAQNKNSVTMGILSNAVANIGTAAISATSPELGMALDLATHGANPSDYMQTRDIKSARISGEHMGLSLGRSITGITNRLAQIADIKNKPDTLATKFNASNILNSINKNGFLFIQKHIDTYHKQMLDQYFSVYGYATNKWLVPLSHINQRQNWTYIKTQNSYAKGNVPSLYLSQIQQIFDNGITFWNDPTKVGNYVSTQSGETWLWNPEYSQ